MHPWIEFCETWLTRQYHSNLEMNLDGDQVRLRWLSADSLTDEVAREEAQGLVIEDSDIGWLLFLLPFRRERLEQQINQSLGVRSRLLMESNYTGNEESGEKEDPDGAWRVGLVWLVEEHEWQIWQRQILELRRESGAAEEISFDSVLIKDNAIDDALDSHGLPRLLLYTRALLTRSRSEAELWLSADNQVSAQFRDFSKQFESQAARDFARQLEKSAKTSQPAASREVASEPRRFRRFRVKHFRNLDSVEIATDSDDAARAEVIVLFGPNGSGKSSIAEAISLAAFGTSPRLEQFLNDRDIKRQTAETYHEKYLVPFRTRQKPLFAWNRRRETQFVLNQNAETRGRYEGVVLNQEDSLKFTQMDREELAALVLRGYSALADQLSSRLLQEEKRTKTTKDAFTRKHRLSGQITLSETAYERLAQGLLNDQLNRPSAEFLVWLDFLSHLSEEIGIRASELASAWRRQQATVVSDLARTLARLQVGSGSESAITDVLREKLNAFDKLAEESSDFRKYVESRSTTLRQQLDQSVTWIDLWAEWLAAQPGSAGADADGGTFRSEALNLTDELADLERRGKMLRGRLDLLAQTQQFLADHWSADHPNTCPVCSSDVADRSGINAVVSSLKEETSEIVQSLRKRYVGVQKRQKELARKLELAGGAAHPLSVEEQGRLMEWLAPFLPENVAADDWLIEKAHRDQLKSDLTRMKVFPEPPKPYSDPALEARRLAEDFGALSQEADRALDGPRAVAEVKKAFEQRMEKVLVDHLPATLGKVWTEITLSLTPAAWLLPALPKLKLDQRGKALSVKLEDGDLFIRYIYNAAERHVLGLAWFFTYYLARRRFEEAWLLLDDSAQEMDQPSFRELVRFVETLLRIHHKNSLPLTMIVALHQEERALDAARATNGRMYVLGWQRTQDDSSAQSSVKKVVLLAPGFHPLKPEMMFGQ